MSRKLLCIYSGASIPLNYVLSDLTLKFPGGRFKYVPAYICGGFFSPCVEYSAPKLT